MSYLIDNIKDLAYHGHKDQYRYGPGHIPYIEHPKAVVETLKSWGIYNEVILAAAWAHDLLEDTDISDADIIQAAGDKGIDVLMLVKSLTYNYLKWGHKATWLKYIAENESLRVMYIKAADRYCNTKDFCKANRYKKAKSYLSDAWPIIEKVLYKNSNARNDFAKLVDEIEKSL